MFCPKNLSSLVTAYGPDHTVYVKEEPGVVSLMLSFSLVKMRMIKRWHRLPRESVGHTISGNNQEQIGWGFEQHNLVGDIPGICRGFGLD